jgi:putative ATPase
MKKIETVERVEGTMKRRPLAERMRPLRLDDIVGQAKLVGKEGVIRKIVEKREPVSLIFWGPPGTGKTTLARIIAAEMEADFVEISAVNAKKADVEAVVKRARENWNLEVKTILFVDEIHRFNKAQQDAFLPHVESGLITLIGATTENPSFEVITPLISRSRVVVLEQLSKGEIRTVIERAVEMEKAGRRVTAEAVDYLAEMSGGDARAALGTLEVALGLVGARQKVTPKVVEQAAGKRVPGYDKAGEEHYNVISAFIKSMRAGEVDAALYYLARMVQAGEDPKFIARRMVIFASEDIGLAAPAALNLALSAFQAIERVGMPEGGIILSHVVVVLAKSQKNRQTYDGWARAQRLAGETMNAPVPIHLRNAPTRLMKDLGYGKTGSGKSQEWTAGFNIGESYLPEDVRGERIFR